MAFCSKLGGFLRQRVSGNNISNGSAPVMHLLNSPRYISSSKLGGMKSTENRTIKSVRRFLLITLSHAESRNVMHKHIVERIQHTFKCRAMIVAKETHKEGGFHYHVGVWNESATRRTAPKVVREIFPEFEDAQIDLKFHKAWPSVCKHVMKQDQEPLVWGEMQLDKIREMLRNVEKHKSMNQEYKKETLGNIEKHGSINGEVKEEAQREPSKREALRKLATMDDWFQVYEDEVLTQMCLTNYSAVRAVFEDYQRIREMKKMGGKKNLGISRRETGRSRGFGFANIDSEESDG